MPVTVNRNFALTINGQTFVLTQEEYQNVKVDEEITVTCDGPRCQARNQYPEPFSVRWRPEEVAKDPRKLPDVFFSMVKTAIDPAQPKEKVFCGPQCLRDFLQYSYIPPQPPRIALENARKEQADKISELNPHLVAGDPKMPVEVAKTILKVAPVARKVFDDSEARQKIDEMGLKPDRVRLEMDVEEAEEVVRKTDDCDHGNATSASVDECTMTPECAARNAPSPVTQADGYVDQEADVHA